ncbi:NCS1 family nucleobase:cation symporter-1 [Streptomyces sp. NPDC056821]|uniref:NCS1 family nucleobase:cation symporter-1 n=1 Tax=unclassified Streptomyces TaxID=2593676 RepID=UPI0036C3D038
MGSKKRIDSPQGPDHAIASVSQPLIPDHEVLSSVDPGNRLYNKDLAPTKPDSRKWNTYSLVALWMSDAHNIGAYTFGAALFATGLAPYQVMIGIFLGTLIVFAGCTWSGYIGHESGGPFPVVQRLSWGVFGANVPALIRAVVGIAWYGIQTFLASTALTVLLLRLAPSWTPLTHHTFLGLNALSWICFLGLWAMQLLVLASGMEIVRRYVDYAGPVIWIIMILLAGWLVVQARGHISFTRGAVHLSVNEQIYQTFAAAGLVTAGLATLMLNFPDFARFAPSKRSITIGNFWGLPVNWTAFAVTSAIVSAGTLAIFGKAILDPAELLSKVNNTPVLIVGVCMFIVATIGVNIVANFVSPAYDLANVWPAKVNFKVGGVITAVLSIVVMPWKLYSSAAVIRYFLGSLGAFLGPLFAIMIVDYYLVRRQRITVLDLYRPSSESRYYYRGGINPIAIAAFIPSAALAAVCALVPAFHRIAPFAWFVGAGIGGVLFWTLHRLLDRQELVADEV